MRLKFRFILMFVALCVCSATLALAAPSISISPTSVAGDYVIQGTNMDGVAGFKLTINYNAPLSSPTVKWGSLLSGGMPIENTTTSGTITVAFIKTPTPLSGSGSIATVTFANHNSSASTPTVSVNQMIDSAGANISAGSSTVAGTAGTATANPVINSTSGVFNQTETIRPPATDIKTTPPPPPPVSAGLGTVSMPGDTPLKAELQPVDPKVVRMPEAAETTESVPQQTRQPEVEKVAEAIEASEVKRTVYSSVLDRFRIYQGEKTPEILMALMTKSISATIRQEPAVAVSDGKTNVRVTVDLSAIKGTSTNFAFTGAKLVSLKKEGDTGIWVLEALPQITTLKAFVTILNSNSVIEFPLTIVPPAAAISSKLADFATFLKDSGSKVPKQDLNGDSLHDYLDDFIYTAHYLINSGAFAKKVKQ